MTFAQRAADLQQRGFSLIPLQACDKKPILGVTSKTRNADVIASWAEQYPDANVGVVADDQFVILDADNADKMLELTGRLNTYTVQSSPGKAHFYFRRNGFPIRNLELGTLGSLRAENMYVVGAGSIHPKTGEPYRVLNDAPVAALHSALYRELELQAQQAEREVERITTNWDGKEKIPAGSRQFFLRSQAGKLHNGERSDEDILAALINLNEKFCSPPKEIHELSRIAAWIVTKEPCNPGEPYPIGKPAEQVNPDDWRPLFHTWEEFEHAPPLKFAIEGWLQAEGITMFGGLPGHGKTWVGMATAKALLTGEPLFGYEQFKVTPAKRVLYLCPEVGLGPLTFRLRKFRLDPFVKSGQLLYRSLSKDPVPIIDPRILRAAEGADVFLDTATRFMEGEENSATDQKIFASHLFMLLKAGARSVVGLHHSAKSSARDSYLSLENALRGSGDIGAMLSTAWAFRQTDAVTNTIHVANIKPRDFQPCEPFTLQGRPYIDDTGNFKLLHPPGQAPQLKGVGGRPSSIAGKEEQIRELLKAGKSYQEVADEVGCSKAAVRRLAVADGLLRLNNKVKPTPPGSGFSRHRRMDVPVPGKRRVSKPGSRKSRPKR